MLDNTLAMITTLALASSLGILVWVTLESDPANIPIFLDLTLVCLLAMGACGFDLYRLSFRRLPGRE